MTPGRIDPQRLAEIRERCEAADLMVSKLCMPRGTEGSRSWVMSIPAQPNYDPDIVIADSLKDVPDLLAEVEALTERTRLYDQAMQRLADYSKEINRLNTTIANLVAALTEIAEMELMWNGGVRRASHQQISDLAHDMKTVAKSALSAAVTAAQPQEPKPNIPESDLARLARPPAPIGNGTTVGAQPVAQPNRGCTLCGGSGEVGLHQGFGDGSRVWVPCLCVETPAAQPQEK
jgi:hypothetical protein